MKNLTFRGKGKQHFGQQITRNPLYVNGQVLSLTCQIRQLNNSVSLQGYLPQQGPFSLTELDPFIATVLQGNSALSLQQVIFHSFNC